MPQALVVAPLALAAVLAVAAIGKLRDPRRGPADVVALRAPLVLRRRWLVRAHPWAELALALGLAAAPTPWRAVAAGSAVALMATYGWLVARLVLAGERVSCACFGRRAHAVTGWTVARNLVLLAVAVVAVLDCATAASPLTRVVDLW